MADTSILSLKQAYEELKNTPAAKSALLALVNRVSVEALGSVTVSFSGNIDKIYTGDIVTAMVDQGHGVRAIGKTPSATFAGSDAFLKKVAEVFKDSGALPSNIRNLPFDHPANLWLNHAEGGQGIWANISKRFIAETTGLVRLVGGQAGLGRIFAVTEFPELLKTEGITDIDGLSRKVLQAIVNAKGLTAATELVTSNTFLESVAVGLYDDVSSKNIALNKKKMLIFGAIMKYFLKDLSSEFVDKVISDADFFDDKDKIVKYLDCSVQRNTLCKTVAVDVESDSYMFRLRPIVTSRSLLMFFVFFMNEKFYRFSIPSLFEDNMTFIDQDRAF